ncbi:unnamed protein product [Calicophoron daubneyi]|uniref:E3 ubiquitin-protein ligase n=1 Tax=Calicophoron daubneyi TaxID=300641 RepID=A0AAV2TMP2_CALDB
MVLDSMRTLIDLLYRRERQRPVVPSVSAVESKLNQFSKPFSRTGLASSSGQFSEDSVKTTGLHCPAGVFIGAAAEPVAAGSVPIILSSTMPHGNGEGSEQSAGTGSHHHSLRSHHHISQCPPSSLYLLPSSVHALNTGDSCAGRYQGRPPVSNEQHVYVIPNLQSHSNDSSFIRCETEGNHLSPQHLQVDRSGNVMPIDLTVSSNSQSQGSTHAAQQAARSISNLHAASMHLYSGAVGPQLGFQTIRDVSLVSPLMSPSTPVDNLTYAISPSVVSTNNYSSAQSATQDNLSTLAPSSSFQPQDAKVPYSGSSFVSLLANTNAPLVVAPLPGGVSYTNHAPTMQQLLSPISVARLISLNSSSYPTPHASKPAVTEIAYDGVRPGHAVTSFRSANKYSRHTVQSTAVVDLNFNPRGRGMNGWTRGSTSQPGGRSSPHSGGINHRIAQLQQSLDDRSMQLIVLQDINQILLMGFEENLVNLNVHGLVSSVLEILESDNEHLVDLKNLSCNVLTHMMDALPRSSDAVVPALPLLLTTMSCSFVGDILERIINLLEQLSRRHGREVLQSGGISSVMGFYDFVTLAQHRTILTMVANCFANLQRSDFDLIADCLPNLSERLKESEQRCVERVCVCFVRLISAYRSEPELLKRIASSCNLFSNLQHLLVSSPPILTGVRDVMHMLAILCSACPDLAVDLIKQNISGTLHCILTGETADTEALHALLFEPISPNPSNQLPVRSSSRGHRSHSRSGGKRSSVKNSTFDIGTGIHESSALCTPLNWHPLMLSTSPLPDRPCGVCELSINQRSQEDLHAIVQLICELLPPVPTINPFVSSSPQGSVPESNVSAGVSSVCSESASVSSLLPPTAYTQETVDHEVDGSRKHGHCADNDKPVGPRRSESERSVEASERRRRSTTAHSQRLSTHLNSSTDTKSTASFSADSSASSSTPSHDICSSDPRSRLLCSECESLHNRLWNSSPKTSIDSSKSSTLSSPPARRRSVGRKPSGDRTKVEKADDETLVSDSNRRAVTGDETEALQLVQILLPLLFELFTETTKLQTRLRCLDAIQRMLFYSSPVLLAKSLRPRVVCSHIVGMLSSPENRIVLSALQISLMLVDKIPPMFATYFRKEGILYQVNQLSSHLEPPLFTPYRAAKPADQSHLSRRDRTGTTPDSSAQAGTSFASFSQSHKHSTHPLSSDNVHPEAPPNVGLDQIRVSDGNSSNDSVQSWTLMEDIADRKPNGQPLSTTSTSPEQNAGLVMSTTPLPLNTTENYISVNEKRAIGFDKVLWCQIKAACQQLQFRVAKLINPTPDARLVSESADKECTQSGDSQSLEHPTLHHPVPLEAVDLMPKLTAIATHLNSPKPALWVFAFNQLIELLKPSSPDSVNPTEPPSPFELEKSGVVAALLSYLTEVDCREVRLWIFYRMFFGSRACSCTRLPPSTSLSHLYKKQNVGKSCPYSNSTTPVLLNSGKAELLDEVNNFLDGQLRSGSVAAVEGPSAFRALLQCLLACLHRHEHFQVGGIPPVLLSDNRLLALLRSSCSSHDLSAKGGRIQAQVSPLITTHLQSDPRSRDGLHGSRKCPTDADRVVDHTRSHKAPSLQTSITGGSSSCAVEPVASSTQNRSTHHPDVIVSQPGHHQLPPPNVFHLPATTTTAPSFVSPTPGLLWIDLVRLPDDNGSTSNTGHKSASPHTTGGYSKGGRKSSSSSTSSNYSTSSSTTMEPTFSIPTRLSLQITALATFQNLERLLLQRNYINSLMHDGIWTQDHDYGSNAPSHIPGEDEFRNLLDVRTSGADSDREDEVQVRDLRKNRDFDHDQSSTLKRTHVVSRSHRNHPISSHPRRSVVADRQHRNVMESQQRDIDLRSVVAERPLRNSRGPDNETTYNPISSAPNPATTLINSTLYAAPILPVQQLQPSEQHQTVSSQQQSSFGERVLRDSSGVFQRNLRTLLQRGAEALPTVVYSGPNKSDDSANSHSDNPDSRALSQMTAGLRRRSTVNLSSVQNRVTAYEVLTNSNAGVELRSAAAPSSHYSLRHFSEFGSSAGTETCGVGVSSNISARTPKGSSGGASFTNEEADRRSDAHGTHSQSQVSSRHRRLKGSSILAAFGALANLSSSTSCTPNSSARQKSSSKHNRGGASSSGSAGGAVSQCSRRSFISNHSSSPISSSTSTSSVSPAATDLSSVFRGKHRPTILFYMGGHQMPCDIPLFEAIRSFSPEISSFLSAANLTAVEQQRQQHIADAHPSHGLTDQEMEDLAGHLIWSTTHVIHYRLAGSSSNVDFTASHRKPLESHSAGTFSHRCSNLLSRSSDGSTSPTSPTSLSSAMTCLKRRRPEEPEAMQIDSSVRHQSACDSNHMPLKTFDSSSGLPLVAHPLFNQLARLLPPGFLTDVHCACDQANTGTLKDYGSSCSVTSVGRDALDDTVSTTLTLLRALHSISRSWYTLPDALDPYPIVSPLDFRSSKLSVKASRQLQDLFTVLAGNIPRWLIQLISVCPFLFPFELRRSFFYAYHFDRDRTLLRFQETTNTALTELDLQQHVSAASRASGLMPSAASMQYDSSVGSPISVVNPVVPDTPTNPSTASSLNFANSAAWPSGVSQLVDPGPLQSVPNTSEPVQRHHHPTSRVRYYTRVALSPNIRRHKVTVHRDGKRLLRQAEATFAELLDSRVALEIAFDGEVGFGLGPTSEFYTLVSRQLMKSALGLWHGNESTADGFLVAPPPGLYPRPLGRQARSTVVRETRSKFVFLGRLMARALLDWRQLDLPFSPAFFKWFLAPDATTAMTEGHILPNDLVLVDPELGRHVRQLTELAHRRQWLCHQLEQSMLPASSPPGFHLRNPPSASSSITHRTKNDNQKPEEIKAALLLLDNEIDELCLNFILPGYEIELVKNGSHVSVTGSNLSEYLRLVAHCLVIEGASRQMQSVLEGFDSVLPDMRQRLAVLFQPDEMEGLFCGHSTSQFELLWTDNNSNSDRQKLRSDWSVPGHSVSDSEGWDVQSLTEACRCDHGYTPQSRAIRFLFEVMSEFNEEQRRLFVQFVTGSPRLPIGGFRALKPPLKIVMKRESGENADDHLPSVMTCQNYLKLPDYSSKELLASKLLYAIREGQNAFHLS